MNRTPEPNESVIGDPPRHETHYISDVRIDAIKQTLDRLTQLGVPTLTARQALDSIARELFNRRGQRPARDD